MTRIVLFALAASFTLAACATDTAEDPAAAPIQAEADSLDMMSDSLENVADTLSGTAEAQLEGQANVLDAQSDSLENVADSVAAQ